MILLVLGISHQKASLAFRERWALDQGKMTELFNWALKPQHLIAEFCIVSTCNRTEFYALLEEPEDLVKKILSLLNLDLRDLEKAYQYTGYEMIKHLLKVATGLDSMLFGEHEIVAQLKHAFNQALEYGCVGPCLNKLWQLAFSTSKKIRHETGLNQYSVSLPGIALKLAKNIFSDFSRLKVLLIGSGDLIKQIGKQLLEKQVKHFWLCNRTTSKLNHLVEYWLENKKKSDLCIQTGSLWDVEGFLGEVDMVITAVNHRKHFISKAQIKKQAQTSRLLYVLDLAVPSNVEPAAGELEHVYLYTVDDLCQIIDQNKKAKIKVAEQAQAMIEEATHKFILWWKNREGQSIVNEYRAHCYNVRDKLLEQAKSDLLKGKTAISVLERFANQLTNQLIHVPTKNLQLQG
ncbi:MAG: glutamyl-tRNA reductase [Gammaproteobacteria bacterium]